MKQFKQKILILIISSIFVSIFSCSTEMSDDLENQLQSNGISSSPENLNVKPVANAGENSYVHRNYSITLDGSNSSDYDGDTITYQWTIISKPSGSNITLSDSTVVNPSFSPDKYGSYEIKLIVNDGKVDSDPDTITISTYDKPVIDTGQTTSYTATFGEDNDYNTDHQPSYTKLDSSGNELPDGAASWAMIKDNITGLIWENKTNDGSIHDWDERNTWFYATETFIPSLNSSNFGGYNDWRLPTIKEINTIINYGRYDPSINTSFFSNTKNNRYLTSTLSDHNYGYIWCAVFGNGDNEYVSKHMSEYFRAVRSD